MAVDPVCGMEVDETRSPNTSLSGRTYYFCSEGCLAEFDRHPDEYEDRGDADADVEVEEM